jgi:hypothetical protein
MTVAAKLVKISWLFVVFDTAGEVERAREAGFT